MLAESFLRVLPYKEEIKCATAPKLKKSEAHTYFMDPFNSNSDSNATDLQTGSAEGPSQEELDPPQCQDLKVAPQGPKGLSIPGCSPVFTQDTDFAVCLDSCSLLEKYPDLQVADPGCISQDLMRAIVDQDSLVSDVCWSAQQEPRREPFSSNPDQGYLVMGSRVKLSLDLPGSGLEPMSNSLLNGLLDKQLDEVYMQHLTDNLARYNSNLGNILLHGLVPPPKPSSQLQGPYSLEASLEEASEGANSPKNCFLSTQNFVPCSSNFSSPVLRISETDNPHLQ